MNMIDTFRRAVVLAPVVVSSLLAPLVASSATPNPPGRVCADAACVTTPTSSPASSGSAVKWHPGNYAWYMPPADSAGRGGYRIDVPQHRDAILKFIDRIANEPAVKGIQIVVFPRSLEGDTPGDYSQGFAAVDAILARLTQYNKRLMLSYQSVVFGNFASQADIWPTYWLRAPLGVMKLGYGDIYNGMTAKTWQAATNDRVIAMSKAYGERYNKNPNFEMITLGETALNIDRGNEGFSNEANLAELKRLLGEARKHWPNTAIRVGANDLAPDSLMLDLFEACIPVYCAVGGPDIWPLDITQADRVFNGLNNNGQKTYKDYRDILPWAIEAQWQSFGGQFTMAQLWNATVNGYTGTHKLENGTTMQFPLPSMKTKYMVWYANETNGNDSTKWDTAIVPFLRSVNGAVHPSASGCPSSYPSCNTN